METNQSKTKTIIEKTGAVLLALLFWQIAAVMIDSSILIVSPISVLQRLCTLWKEEHFWDVILFTFSHIAIGYFIAVICGVFAAFLSARFHLAEVLLRPWMISIRSVPVASMVVIFLIWVSAGNLSIIISFLVVFPVIYSNTLTGLKNLNDDYEELAQVFGIHGMTKILYVILPQIRASLLGACALTAGMAWKAGVAAEIIGTPPNSVGKMIYQSKIWLDTDDLLAWTVLLVLLSVIFEKLVAYLFKKLLESYT